MELLKLYDRIHNVLLSPVILSVLAGTLLCACAPVGPDFVKPDIEVNTQWVEAITEDLDTSTPKIDKWWEVFDDPILNSMVELARKNNNTLEVTALRVLEARAQLGIATGSLYPQSQLTLGEALFAQTPKNVGGLGASDWNFRLAASASWEIDFWGKFRRGIEATDAAFLASIAAYNQALVLLTATVVDTYTLAREAEEQLRIARQNAELQQKSYNIAHVLYEKGETSELDMQQANTLLLSTQATIPNLELQLTQAQNALSTLVGEAPGYVNPMLEEGRGLPALPDKISIGFPADMLRRRPDVYQAELLAMSQNALVGVARADMYPSFSLLGSIGLAAGGIGDTEFGDLFESESVMYSTGGSFVWPFLNYGRIKNNIRVQDARLQQALAQYRAVVLQAAQEAENAIAGVVHFRKQGEILARGVASAERSAEISTLRYQEGLSDYLRVLNSQQSLFSQQQRLATNQSNVVASLVALYRSLGGGWQEQGKEPYIDPETLETMRERTDWGKLIPINTEDVDRSSRISKPDW